MRAIVLALGAVVGLAALILARRAYINHLVYKSLKGDIAVAKKKAIFDRAMQESYSDGWDAGYKKAWEEAERMHYGR